MATQITQEQVTELQDAFVEFGEFVQEHIAPALEAIGQMGQRVYDAFWQAYRDAGTPFGETHEGLLRWVTLMAEMRMHEEKAAQIRSDLIGYAQFRQKVLASRALQEAHNATER